MDSMTLVGIVAAASALLFYAFEDRSLWCVLGFALSALVAACVSALLSLWWFSAIAAGFAFLAFKRWQKRRLAGKPAV